MKINRRIRHALTVPNRNKQKQKLFRSLPFNKRWKETLQAASEVWVNYLHVLMKSMHELTNQQYVSTCSPERLKQLSKDYDTSNHSVPEHRRLWKYVEVGKRPDELR